jgi:hypothetical protein
LNLTILGFGLFIQESAVLGITLKGASGIGDKLQFASFPENHYRHTGEKVIDLDSAWVFDHNPFVVRGEIPTSTVNLWMLRWPSYDGQVSAEKLAAQPGLFSHADRTASIFYHVPYLRHPRLYIYEDLKRISNRVVIHTTGNRRAPILTHEGEDQARILSEDILDHIRKTYRTWDLIQVGAKDDVDAGVVDCRGMENFWDAIKIIAQATVFIGVDSGPSWVAACYPGIFNKRILMQYPPEFLRSAFVPMHILRHHQHWHDSSFIYYNRSKDDAGVTYSYLKV